jgi:AraC family transcriptional regulator
MDHRESIQAAVDYIEERLAGKLNLNMIAEQALFSPWQFHRMFTFMVGIPVMAYVRARRLSVAARALMSTKRRMVEIALDAGYESQQAFTRAFVKAFGVTPGACRRSGELPDMLCLVEAWSYERRMEMDIKPDLVTIEDFWVVGMGVTTSVEENMKDFVIPKLWERFMPFMEKGVPGRTDDHTSYGVCDGDGTRFKYLAGVPVGKDTAPSDGLEKQHVPGGRYAVFVHRGEVGEGKLEGLSKTFQYIYNQWLPGSEYEYDMDRVDFEKYGPAFCAEPPEMELYIPIRKKTK